MQFRNDTRIVCSVSGPIFDAIVDAYPVFGNLTLGSVIDNSTAKDWLAAWRASME